MGGARVGRGESRGCPPQPLPPPPLLLLLPLPSLALPLSLVLPRRCCWHYTVCMPACPPSRLLAPSFGPCCCCHARACPPTCLLTGPLFTRWPLTCSLALICSLDPLLACRPALGLSSVCGNFTVKE